MQLKIKTTGFKLSDDLRSLATEKLLKPSQKRLGGELDSGHILEVELAKITEHHEVGKIWKCEVNIEIPHSKQTIYAKAIEESLEIAIDEVKDQLEREINDFKNKRASKFIRVARKLKDAMHVSQLAQNANDFYKWVRRK